MSNLPKEVKDTLEKINAQILSAFAQIDEKTQKQLMKGILYRESEE